MTDAELEIERVVAGGDGLARHESLVVFVPRTLAGERVRARLVMKGRHARGSLIEIQRASPARVASACAHYVRDRCGGCQLQHATYDEQLRIKGQIVADAMRRIAHVTVPVPAVLPSESPWRYRHKLTLAMRRVNGAWIAGLRRLDAPDDVFGVEDCHITAEPVLEVWRAVMRAAAHFPGTDALRGVARVSEEGGASFVLEGGRSWPAADAFFDAVPAMRSVWWIPDGGIRRLVRTRADESTMTRPDASFAQVNVATAPGVLAYVLDRVRGHAPSRVIDAYAGIGDTSAALDDAGIHTTAIELDRDAAEWAAERLSPESAVIIDRVEHALEGALPADVLIVNPPRTGVDARVCDVINDDGASLRAIVYVSCDPATLARDVSRLRGWRIASMVCFDMFPQTAHVETVCELVRDAA